jgi:hypothetical protein
VYKRHATAVPLLPAVPVALHSLAITVNDSASSNPMSYLSSWLLKCTRTICHDKLSDDVTYRYVPLLIVNCCLVVVFKLWIVEPLSLGELLSKVLETHSVCYKTCQYNFEN